MTEALARRLELLRAKGAMRSVDLAYLLAMRPETVTRWIKGRAYPHAPTEKALLRLEYIVDLLADLYEPSEARLWIFAPQKLFGGVSPAELIRNGHINQVTQLVLQLREAVHFDVPGGA